MAFTKTWTESDPADTEAASLGDDRIRNLAFAIRERGGVQHKTYADETGQTDVWEHTPGQCTVIYEGAKAGFPTPATTTKGCIAIATDENNRPYHWDGSAWAEIGLVLTGGQAQTIAGVKTLSEIPAFTKGVVANNAYLQARNVVGDGNVNMIKVDTAEKVIIFQDATHLAELATSDAPSANAGIANKKYIDDLIAAQLTLSESTDKDSEDNGMLKDHAYKAQTAGRASAVAVSLSMSEYVKVYVGTTSDPYGAGHLEEGQEGGTSNPLTDHSVSALVAKDEYFEIRCSVTPTIRWRSFGTLQKPIDQEAP